MIASIIITTWSRKESLKNIIDVLRIQLYPQHQYEIIVCDSNSPDGTSDLIIELIRDNPNLNIKITHSFNSISHKRNQGIKVSRGEFLIFLDDDCIPQENFIENHIKFGQAISDKALISGVIIYKNISLFKSKSYVRYKQKRHELTNSFTGRRLQKTTSIVAMNLCIKKSYIIDNDIYFNEKICAYGLEDYDFAKKCESAGFLHYIGIAAVDHKEINATFGSLALKIRELSRRAMPIIMSETYSINDLPFVILEKNNFFVSLIGTIPKTILLRSINYISFIYDNLPFVPNIMVRLLIALSYILGKYER